MIYTTDLKKRREAKHLTLPQLSEMIGLGVATLSRIENGKSDMYVTTLILLAEFYGCGITDIVKYDKPVSTSGKSYTKHSN